MGHAIGGGFLEAKTKEQAMKEGYADAEEFAYYNGDRLEGSDNYHGDFSFYNRTFNTEDEAIRFFDDLGSYRDGVCMVRAVNKSIEDRFANKKARVSERKRNYWNKVLARFKERTSRTVGCRNCGSRVDSETAIRRNLRCPMCGQLLVPNTVKADLQYYDDMLAKIEEDYKKECAASNKIRYYAKYEVHC